MSGSYSDYLSNLLTQLKPTKKPLSGTMQYVGGIATLPFTVTAAYQEGIVVKFDGGNVFIPYTSIAKLSLDNF